MSRNITIIPPAGNIVATPVGDVWDVEVTALVDGNLRQVDQISEIDERPATVWINDQAVSLGLPENHQFGPWLEGMGANFLFRNQVFAGAIVVLWAD